MSRIRTTRQVRALRKKTMRQRRCEQEIQATYLRMTRRQVQSLQDELDPQRKLVLQQNLAYWSAAVDSLEEDGVMPEPKGAE